ncbi:hypothetical protein B1R29_14380 [Pseudomonas aeruginosa]|nr:hypothetical protein B1R29_14380 [Pseudomonas aeruginosa]
MFERQRFDRSLLTPLEIVTQVGHSIARAPLKCRLIKDIAGRHKETDNTDFAVFAGYLVLAINRLS